MGIAYLNDLNNDLSRQVVDRGLLEDLFAELGCDFKERYGDRRYRGPCPIHDSDNPTAFEVRVGGHDLPIYWRCFTNECERKPGLVNNLLGLVRGVLARDPDRPAPLKEATAFVRKFLARAGTRPPRPPKSEPAPCKPLALTREQVRSRLHIPSRHFLDRGFDRAVLDALDVGESDRLGRVVVPVYGDDGKTCVGFTRRSLRPYCSACDLCHPREWGCSRGEPKWKVQDGFEKGYYLYNLAGARLIPAPFVLLVEGPPDVFRGAQAGLPTVATFGVEVSETQLVKLAAMRRRVVVAFDNDKRGRSRAPLVADKLRARGVEAEVRHPPAPHKDVGEMPAAEVTGWLADLMATKDEHIDCPF
jgi:hypothetical protein